MSRPLALEGGPFERAVLVKLGARRKRCQGAFASMVLLCSKAWRPYRVMPSISSSPQDLYLLIMKDESLYQDLREDTLRLHQLVETVELK